MIRAVIHKTNGKYLELLAPDWDALFDSMDATEIEAMQAEVITEEDWDE